MENHIKYRSELFAGTGYREAAPVMAFETFELGNCIILETLAETVLKAHPIKDELLATIAIMNETGEIRGQSNADGVLYFERVLDAIEDVTGKRIVFVLWLADRANAYRYALSGEDITLMNKVFTQADIPADYDGLDAYIVSDAIPLSELDWEDGCLYGFTSWPLSHEDISER